MKFAYFFVSFFFQGYWGCAIGKARQAAKTEIEKLQVRCYSFVVPFQDKCSYVITLPFWMPRICKVQEKQMEYFLVHSRRCFSLYNSSISEVLPLGNG